MITARFAFSLEAPSISAFYRSANRQPGWLAGAGACYYFTMGITEILVLCGGFAGGYVSGLTGFGTGLSALPFWLNAVNPVLAAPLVVICSIVAQLQTLPAIWHAIDWRQVLPFVLGGLLGVPAGTLLFRDAVVEYRFGAGVQTVRRHFPDRLLQLHARASNRARDHLGRARRGRRNWICRRHSRRPGRVVRRLADGMGQPAGLGKLVMIALPGTLLGAWLGRKTYNRLGDYRFNQVVLLLLLLSGISIVVTTFL
jgi:hypothetical protein